MSTVGSQDVCGECAKAVPDQALDADPAKREPCPHCGSTKRIMSGNMSATATARVDVDAQLIIGWQEVDRLLDKAEYGAALLVAAINVQFIRRVARPTAPTEARHDEKSAPSEALVREITRVRNKLAHERGHFALLTQLKDPSWLETRIRQILDDAKAFCHGSALWSETRDAGEPKK